MDWDEEIGAKIVPTSTVLAVLEYIIMLFTFFFYFSIEVEV